MASYLGNTGLAQFGPAGSLRSPEGEREKPQSSEAPSHSPIVPPWAQPNSEKLLKGREGARHTHQDLSSHLRAGVERQEGERGSNSQKMPALGVLARSGQDPERHPSCFPPHRQNKQKRTQDLKMRVRARGKTDLYLTSRTRAKDEGEAWEELETH